MIPYIQVAGGVVLLLLGGEWLVKASVDIALRLKISILVVGMTVVSFATSAPELLVSAGAAMSGHPDISLGNVLGSNLANISLVLGVTALIFPITVQKQTYNFDWWILFGITLLLYLFLQDGSLDFWEALLLLIFIVVYNFLQIYLSRRKGKKASAEEVENAQSQRMALWKTIGFLVIGVAALKFGSDILVEGSVTLASSFGISERVIGLTIVSIGTSLPELAASMVASFKGKQELSLGNLIGSNIFNIGAVLGLTGIITPIPVQDMDLLQFDMPWVVGITLLLYPFIRFVTKGRIERWEAAVMLGAYAVYVFMLF